jgi:hypothetical protein
MRPFSIAYSEAAIQALPSDSLICPPFHPESIYQKGSDGWVEPGVEDTIPTSALWEVLTGSYDGYVPDEEREVWVIYDATYKAGRPPRPKSSPDYATRVQARDPEMALHGTLDEARAAIEAAVGSGVTAGHTNIWHRTAVDHVFRASVYIEPGTPVAEFPWKSPDA